MLSTDITAPDMLQLVLVPTALELCWKFYNFHRRPPGMSKIFQKERLQGFDPCRMSEEAVASCL